MHSPLAAPMPVRLVSNEEPLPGYRLIERLGRGGFGEVWKVEAPGGLMKAMKFVFGDLEAADEESRPAEQELKALRRVQDIRHPYVLSLERYDILEGQLIIVMELADRNLWDQFRECRSQGLPGIPREILIRFMEEAAEALDLMNNHYQIQHLDIKPQNLFVVFNHVKVGDFGLAKLMDGIRATVTGGVTPVYAAPETFEGWVSRFSDQYSLAIVFQELLTGTRPFNGANTRQLLMQHINGTPDLGALPADDRPIIARGLSKKPDDRWPSCSEMVRALRVAGLPPTPLTPATRFPNTTPVGNGHAPETVFPPTGDSGMPTRVQTEARGGAANPPNGHPGLFATPAPRSGNILNTPLPPLVTAGFAPRLVTPSAAGGGTGYPAVTLQRPQVMLTGRMGSLGIAPPEKTGDGTLFPALVVALGHVGRGAADQLRQVIRDRYGGLDAAPHVRFLYIDTDPEAANPAEAEAGREVVLARLNRPAHYLQRESLPPVEPWMPPGALYRLARNPESAGGVRAFGRLALFDNYRLIAQRLRQEIETFLTDDPLAKADKATGLGLRTNRPRAYVLAGLGGGTGGGMFLDLAYLLRHELRSVGYMKPDVAGVFFVPPADKTASRNAALGNAFAALTELYQFQARRTRYQTTFDKAEPPVIDNAAPFDRAAVLPLPKVPDPKQRRAITGQAARALFQELLTPAGRVADEVRDVYRNAFPSPTPTCQTFGLFRLSWPRPELLAAATRRFAQRLLQRWTAKDAAHLREPIAAWLDQQWASRKLEFETIVEAFNGTVRNALREEPDKVFDAFIDPLRTRAPSGGKLDAAAACTVLDQLIKVVGKPDCEDDPNSGSLYPTLAAKYEEVAKEAEGQLAFMAVSFIEQPQYRLAGAEEAVRQIADKLKHQIDALEPLQKDLDKEVRNSYARLFQVIGGLGASSGLGAIGARKSAMTAETLELLRNYPRKRLQLHVLSLALSVYRKLFGNAPEYLREINYCRATLVDMHAILAKAAGGAGEPVGGGKLILPDGCKDLDGAADLFLAGLNPEEILAFDQGFQKDTTRKFRGLAAVCLKPAEKGSHFRDLLLTKARAFLDDRLDKTDPAAAFFRSRPDGPASHPLVGEAFQEAAPDLPPKPGTKPEEIVILAVPPGEAGDKFRALAAEAVPGIDLTPAPLPDDICFYREYPKLELADVPQLGEVGRDAYQQLLAGDHPPHSRTDIPWQPAGGT